MDVLGLRRTGNNEDGKRSSSRQIFEQKAQNELAQIMDAQRRP